MKVIIALLFFVGLAASHTIMITPPSRENSVHTNAGNYQCGTSGNIQGTYSRGQTVQLTYGRNNHWGGFSALSVLPLSRAGGGNANNGDVINAFNDPANIFHTSCYNSGANCKACNGCADKFGLGGDGTDFQRTICSHDFKIPTWLDDGEYVMKWLVFGNGDSFGVRNMPHGLYSNCHNFRVSGGAAKTAKPGGNRHIEFTLRDNAIDTMNQRAGVNINQNQCMFCGGSNSPATCKFIDGQRSAFCSGPVANLAKCGTGQSDSRGECLGGNNEGQTQGGDLFNYLVGIPSYHPDYNGNFKMLSHARASARDVSIPGAGPNIANPNTGGNTGNTGGNTGNNDGTCPADGNCIKAPGCCGSGQLCYEKDQYWASCMNTGSCAPGIHSDDPPQYQTPWSCRPLGVNTAARPFGIFWQKNGDRVVDVSASRNENGNNVFIWQNLGPGFAQRWIKTNKDQLKWYTTSKCLDVTGGVDQNGNNVQIWDCNDDNKNQKFYATGWGGYKWADTNKCLDVAGGGEGLGTNLQIWDCNQNNINQKFTERVVLTTTTVAGRYTDVTSKFIQPLTVNYNWGPKPDESETVVVVPLSSTINFVGSTVNNTVKKVCEGAYTYAGPVNASLECREEAVSFVGNWVAESEGKFFFIGDLWSQNQKLTVVVTSATSLGSAADIKSANEQLGLNTDTNPTPTNTDSGSNTKYIIIGCVIGGVALIAAVAIVAFFIHKRKSSGNNNHVMMT
eukprot:TRINITY_DN5636_c0_g1_i2.p1 TRINITY_DN5636_c0_g1~~TRINITY_DN5636_c0_g1_i2.p1  ORF type:complete len:732 (+),score=274.29 TRINITY_DN5636_c0_g1_i2:106-2301(+)